MKKIPLLMIAVCLLLSGCRSSTNYYPVTFVERSEALPEAEIQKTNPLLLVVEINGNGKLKLNKIETGTIADLSVLSEKIEAIFEDRRNNGVTEREIFVDLQGTIKGADLKKLIENLAARNAVPIRVIKNNS